MDGKMGRLRRWGMVIFGVSLGIASTGCSTFIAYSGIASPRELNAPVTRTEVRLRFGSPTRSETRTDGTSLETYHVRRRIASRVNALGGDFHSFLFTYGLVEVIAAPVALYHSENAKLQVTFVYGADNRVVCHYRPQASPASRFEEATLPLAASLWVQLEAGVCPNWETCLDSFVKQVRERAAYVGYTPSAVEEAQFTSLLAIAEDADKSRLTKNEALAEVQRCLGSNDGLAPYVRPSLDPSDPSLAGGPSREETPGDPA